MYLSYDTLSTIAQPEYNYVTILIMRLFCVTPSPTPLPPPVPRVWLHRWRPVCHDLYLLCHPKETSRIEIKKEIKDFGSDIIDRQVLSLPRPCTLVGSWFQRNRASSNEPNFLRMVMDPLFFLKRGECLTSYPCLSRSF